MEITTRRVGECIVLDCSGLLTLGSASLALREAIREGARQGTLKVALNLKDVPSMDSGGLGEIISGYVHVINQGGKLVFLNPPKKFLRVIANMKLAAIFDVYDDEQKALEGCG